MSMPDKQEVHPVQSKLIELPIQLRDGSWIMLSDITRIICRESSTCDLFGYVEVHTIKDKIHITIGNKDARDYANLLGSQWRQSIIDRANHEAEFPGTACEPRNCPHADREAKPQDTVEDWHEKTGDI